ncbi:hypothetical protein IQ63_09530 [Streptomyces acidiscabies]|uniref:Uncharacterized protein n=1 Tax=Streptomyces acidiscabies TaxID=42234 RepID=A0A0L0KJ88_9ACTN|nr:hypothetical protein IQ63_09530 [Streptomyces acidiscabies]
MLDGAALQDRQVLADVRVVADGGGVLQGHLHGDGVLVDLLGVAQQVVTQTGVLGGRSSTRPGAGGDPSVAGDLGDRLRAETGGLDPAEVSARRPATYVATRSTPSGTGTRRERITLSSGPPPRSSVTPAR